MTEWLASIDWSIWYGWIFTIDGWISLITLSFLEIILGIDNLVFLTIASQRLPKNQRAKAQRLGLSGALVLRIAMLSILVWLTKLQDPHHHGRRLHPHLERCDFHCRWRVSALEGHHRDPPGSRRRHGRPQKVRVSSFLGVIGVIMVIDFVFALDSIITAVGLSQFLPVMILANVIAIAVMLSAARPVGDFIEDHPTVKMLALAFILLVGLALVADGVHMHIPRGFIYFAIAFSLAVEVLNLLVRRRAVAKNHGKAKTG